MKLRSIEYILADIDFKEVRLLVSNPSATTRRIENIDLFKEYVSTVEGLGFFDKEVKALKNSVLYSTSQDSLTVDHKKITQTYGIANYVVQAGESLYRALGSILEIEAENSIGVKLPEPSDFKDLIKSMETIEKVLSQVVHHQDIGGSITINRWDSGSYWVELILGTQAAVTLVAGIAWSSAVVYKKLQEAKIFEEHAKSLKIKNESLEDITKQQKELTSLLIAQESKAIQIKNFKNEDDNEVLERIKHSVKTFAELIQSGAEVHPALSAPESVENLFPNFKKLETISSRIKQIEDQHTDK